MSDIAPISSASISAAAATGNDLRARREERAESADVVFARDTDAVEFSPLARFAALARENPVREDLIARVREEIAKGNYDSDDKLDKALDEMLSDFR